MKACVLTGATGLVGGALLRRLAAAGWRVHALARDREGPDPELADVTWVKADLSRPWDASALPARADTVVHAAQTPSYHRFPECAEEIFAVGVASTLRLLEYAAAAGAAKFVLASSGGVYGTTAAPAAEDAPVRLEGDQPFFLRCKACAEQLVEGYRGRLDGVVARLFFVYGPGQRRAMLLPRLVDSVAAGRPVTLQGEAGLHLNPLHVSDCAEALHRALELPGGAVVNLAGPEVLSLREVAETIGRAVGREPVFQVEPAEGPRYMAGDITRAARLLGAPRVRFADGVRDLL
jgi:nucleoside-diphosphate-sugar epimerase